MQWFFLCLSIVWTAIFCCIFYTLVPDHNKSNQMPSQQIIIKTCDVPTVTTRKYKKSKEIPLPLDQDEMPAKIKVNEEVSSKAIQKDLEPKVSDFEQRLVNILVKVNATTCKSCTNDDKRILLQLKMMKALLEGNTSDALKINAELSKYVSNHKKVEVLPPPLKD